MKKDRKTDFEIRSNSYWYSKSQSGSTQTQSGNGESPLNRNEIYKWSFSLISLKDHITYTV